MQYTDAQVLMGLSKVSGLGPISIRRVIEFTQEKNLSMDVFWKNIEKFVKELPLSERVCDALVTTSTQVDPNEIWQGILEKGCQVISLLDDTYPGLLKQMESPPIVLYAKGDISLLKSSCLAVVGTRKVTSYGRLATAHFTQELVRKKHTIVSGFMYGVDAIAHRTAIDNQGKTIGVLGYGFDYMYPKSHTHFFNDVLVAGGCFVTEFSPEIGPIPTNFPQRNRIVAGLSRGVLVTEAAAESGSKITAQLAAEMGREVFAVSGPFTSPFSEGTKQLVNIGAKLVTKIEDISEELENSTTQALLSTKVHDLPLFQPAFDSIEESQIYELLRVSEKEAGEIVEELTMSLSGVLTTLSMMEMNGVIVQEKGKYWLAAVK